MYSLTHKNIYLRYLAQRDATKRRRKLDKREKLFSYREMGKLFTVTKQACYEWTTAKLPRGPRRGLVHAWINDGELDQYLERMRHGD